MSEWILTAEELPEEEGRYLASLRWRTGFVKVLYYGPSNEWEGNMFYDIHMGVGRLYDDSEVLAWMPLPKPYEIDEDDE